LINRKREGHHITSYTLKVIENEILNVQWSNHDQLTYGKLAKPGSSCKTSAPYDYASSNRYGQSKPAVSFPLPLSRPDSAKMTSSTSLRKFKSSLCRPSAVLTYLWRTIISTEIFSSAEVRIADLPVRRRMVKLAGILLQEVDF